MKVLALVFVAVIASGMAIPQPGAKFDFAPQVVNEVSPVASFEEELTKNVISDLITSIIQRISQVLQDLGLDPLNIRGIGFGYSLPVPSLFGFAVNVPSFSLGGISNIIINHLSYGLLSSRLTFDISMPEIVIDFVEDSDLVVRVLSTDLIAQYNGRVAIQDVGLRGDVRINLGIIGGGVSIREINLNFYLGGLNADIRKLHVLGEDLTFAFERFIRHDLFHAIKSHEEDISDMIEIIAWNVIGIIFQTKTMML